MKIGIFDPYLDTLSGGEKYMLTIASCLSFSNEVYLFWDPSKAQEIKEKAHNKLGIDISSVKFSPNIFSSKQSPISRIIKSKEYDKIIYLSDGSMPFVLSKLYIHFQFPVEWVKVNFLKTKIKLSRTNGVFCNSKFTKSYIDKKFNIDSKVLYPSIEDKTSKDVKKENIILHVGRFGIDREGANYKKQDIMIKVFKEMVDKGLKNWKMVLVVGISDYDKEKVKKLKQEINNYPIEIIENPSNEILWEYYAKSKIYWHASGFGEDLINHPEKAEHFGISTVESMGAGNVPVVINAGGQKEIVENEKSGFLWDSLYEFQKKSKLLIDNDKLWKDMSEEAKRRSKVFENGNFCKELEEIIK